MRLRVSTWSKQPQGQHLARDAHHRAVLHLLTRADERLAVEENVELHAAPPFGERLGEHGRRGPEDRDTMNARCSGVELRHRDSAEGKQECDGEARTTFSKPWVRKVLMAVDGGGQEGNR